MESNNGSHFNEHITLTESPAVSEITVEQSNLDKLKTLISDRRDLAERMRKLGDKSHERLSKLYSNKTHFITELLQNAEDEGAKNVKFILTEDYLEFSHDAKKLFDFNDIRAISNFGDNDEKKEKPNAIGRFGIGFKSVYSITNTPRIISAEYDITIVDYNVPTLTEGEGYEYYEGTKIVLPFKEENKIETFELLNNELKNLNINYLLFLTNINCITCNSTVYERFIERKDKRFETKIIVLKSEANETKYLFREKKVDIAGKNLLIKIAFLLNDQGKVTEAKASPLFVFFPTKIETNLKFFIHAPFNTTPARESIEENDSRNTELMVQLGVLLAECLNEFKRMRTLSVELLNVMPINFASCSRSLIYKILYNAVFKEFKDDKQLIPNVNGGFSAVSDSMLLGSADLAELLSTKQNKKLFDRSFWVNKGVTLNRTPDLWNYLRLYLNVPENDLKTFALKVNEAFLLEQPDSWLILFYKIIHKAPALWKKGEKEPILRSKPIIRVEYNGERRQVIPFTNGKPNVFLSGKEQSHYLTVKENLIKNKDARRFLEELGLEKPNLFAEVNKFILPNLQRNTEINQEYFDNLKKVIEALKMPSLEDHARLIVDLGRLSFIIGVNYETGETKLLKYYEVYLENAELKHFFKGNPKGYFVADEQYKINNIDIAFLKSTLKELGVKDYPKRREFPSILTWEEKAKLRNSKGYTGENYCKDYDLDGLDFFLKQSINIENSLALWRLLLKCISVGYSEWNREYFFKGEYSFKYYGNNTRHFDSWFFKQLKNTPWVVNDKGETTTPSNVSFAELPDEYKKYDLSQKLSEILGFKPDTIRIIEQTTGGKFISKEELIAFENFKKWQSEQNKTQEKVDNNEQKEEKGFEPEYKPGETTLNSRELKPSSSGIKFEKRENNPQPPAADRGNIESNGENEGLKPNQKLIDDIGKWGQEYVAGLLVEEFKNDPTVEIVDLNTPGNKGVGCDFIVQRGKDIIRYIEVKTTTENFGQTISISGTQWEVARTLFKESDGDKYWVYCVFNAGKKEPDCVIIKNPHQRWKEGTLFAHPVYFIIRDED